MSESKPRVTHALILAAGQGSRLNHATPKPLFPILGVPLLVRTLHTLGRAGIEDAHVVLGFEGEQVRRGIEAVRGLEVRVHWVDNPRWKEPNGVSVLAAAEALTEPFVMTMSDHLFESRAVERLLAGAGGLDAVDLVVDRRVREVNDIDDATKVRLEGDRIVDIGKALEDFDAIDTGVFLASPALFEALRGLDGAQGPSLSAGVKQLAAQGRVRAVDGSDLLWQDVDTQSDVAEAERRLMATWPKPSDGPVSRYINRPLSKAVTRRLVNTPVTPNQVSLATLVLGLISAWLAAVGGYGAWLASGLLFQIASILDGTDGELAVLTYRTSKEGAWVDTVCDNVSYLAFLIGLTVGVYRAGLPPLFVWGGFLSLAAAAISLGNINLYLLREAKSGSALSLRYGYEEGDGTVRRVFRALKYLGKRDLLSFLLLLFAVAGQLPLALPVFGIGAMLLLVPATIWANISLSLRQRGVRATGGGG